MKIAIGSSILSLLIAIGSLYYSYTSNKKIGVINLNTVFEKFEGSKKAADELIKTSKKYESVIDSLNHKITLLSTNEDNKEQIKKMQYVVFQLTQKGEVEYRKTNDDLSVGVQNKINTYLEIYRKENGFDVLISQYQNTGAIALDENIDVTSSFVTSLNEYYFHVKK